MDQAAIFLPTCALVAWTFMVLLAVPIARFRAGARATVFRPNRHFINLLELPVLFYVVCIALYITLSVDAVAVRLAWLYVALRVAHSVVQLTYNNVYHRLGAYALSAVVLAALWIRFAMALAQR